MKTYEEIAAAAVRRGEELRRQRRKRVGAALCALVFVLAGTVAFTLGRGLPKAKTGGEPVEELATESAGLPTLAGATSAVTQEAPTSDGSVPSPRAASPEELTPGRWPDTVEGHSDYGSGGNEAPTLSPAVPAGEKLAVTFTGENFRAEAEAYLRDRAEGIKNELAASGVAVTDFRVDPNAYCHLRLTDAGAEIDRSWLDALCYSGDEVVAILSLHWEDGKIYCTPAFGGPWFPAFSAFLRENRGEGLRFLWIGNLEFVVSPSGVVNPMGYEIYPEALVGLQNPYLALDYDEITYTPAASAVWSEE